MGVPLHVQQGHGADDGAEELRVLHEHVANEEAAVAATHGSQPPGGRDACADQVFGHGCEVLVRPVLALPHRRLVPCRAKLAATTDVCQRVGSPFLQPRHAQRPGVAGQQRDLEPPVAIEDCGLVRRGAAAAHEEVGHPRAIEGRCPVLRHLQAAGIEHRPLDFELLRLLRPRGRRREAKHGRVEEALARDPEAIRGLPV
mmetsp:Transcript_106577/g.343878  ORF Transcript_106577/g.343878 Transcript_106577/m.343878 type:complete len:200 (+) Transcript_106577:846-1445(+)